MLESPLFITRQKPVKFLSLIVAVVHRVKSHEEIQSYTESTLLVNSGIRKAVKFRSELNAMSIIGIGWRVELVSKNYLSAFFGVPLIKFRR
jgi:outer membrane scaffolding protein for murein synthesis (MipA/OmpV family)